MDWTPVLAFALGGLFNAVIAGVTTEWQTRRAERRQQLMQAADRVRSRNLEILRETREMTVAWCEWRLRSIAGGKPFDGSEFDDSRWPMASTLYVGEEAANRMLDLKPLLNDEAAPRDRRIAAMVAFRRAAEKELRAQEERALRDEPLVSIDEVLDAQLGD